MDELPAWRYRIAPKARLVFDRTRGKHMLIYPERGLELNEVAHAILSLCDGQHSVARMVEVLSGRFGGADDETVARDVMTFLAQLEQRGVLLKEE